MTSKGKTKTFTIEVEALLELWNFHFFGSILTSASIGFDIGLQDHKLSINFNVWKLLKWCK